MQFYDQVSISVQSGKGGNGVVSARRESGVPFGGPSGGNGGDGGSVIIKASKDENTLLAYKYIKNYKAQSGEQGKSKDQYGANAPDIELLVPIGTIVKDKKTGTIVHHFTQHNEKWLAVKGGEGGMGNIMFKDSVHQFPTFALLGEPGQIKEFSLELQLVADVALIGTPSVGKSSIINTVAATKAKVADYPFTTLIPHLGSIEVANKRFNIVDVPGLIKGASEGKGLGNTFLRHILKAKVLCFVVDISRFDKGMDDATILFDELDAYIKQQFIGSEYIGSDVQEICVDLSIDEKNEQIALIVSAKKGRKKEALMQKMIQFVINKHDLIGDEEIVTEYRNAFWTKLKKYAKKKRKCDLSDNILYHTTFIVSAATHHGLEHWLHTLAHTLDLGTDIPFHYIPVQTQEVQEVFIKDITETEKEYLVEHNYIQEVDARFCKVRYVSDPHITKLVFTLMRGNDEAEMRFWKTMQSRGYMGLLDDAGVRKGDVLKIRSFYPGEDDKYILF